MKYELLGEDDSTYKIKHPDGSEFHVAKKGIDDKIHKKIKALPMASGGIVPDASELESDAALIDSLRQDNPMAERDNFIKNYFAQNIGGGIAGSSEDLANADYYKLQKLRSAPAGSLSILDEEKLAELERSTVPINKLPTSESAQLPPMAVDNRTPAVEPTLPQQAPTITQQPQGVMGDVARSFALKESAIRQGAAAEVEAQKAREQLAIDQQKQFQEQFKKYELKRAELDAESNNIRKAIQDNKIDPNRFYSNMSTGNKVLAAISVALSGVGAGLQGPGTPNLALQVLNKKISEDIDAQKSELGKKENLLSENMRRYGSLDSAMQATMLQLNTAAQAEISKIASKQGSKQAIANAQALTAELGLQAAQLKEQLSQKAALQNMSASGLSEAQAMGAPEQIRQRLVKVGDKYVPALDESSAKEARKIVGANDAMMANLDRLIALRTRYGSETLPGPVKAEMQTLAANLQLSLKEAKALGTLDRGAEKFMEKLVADPTSYGVAIADQYQALKNAQNRETRGKLQSLGISLPEISSDRATVERITQDGRIALFDPQTKKFIRFKE